MRKDSIRAKGLEAHVNEYCLKHKSPFRYKHLVEWLEQGNLGEEVSKEWIRRRFAPLSRPAFEKWLQAYKEEKAKK